MTPTSLISGIPDTLKQKIWRGEYVDLALLLYRQESRVHVSLESHGEGPELILDQKASKKIANIADWHKAFARLHSLLVQQRPNIVVHLVAHEQQVWKLANNGGDWKGYDEAYRRGVADSTITWGQMNPGLIMDAMWFDKGKVTPFLDSRRQAAPFKQRDQNIPKGYCFRFHKFNQTCKPRCNWNHECPKCKGKHSLKTCTN